MREKKISSSFNLPGRRQQNLTQQHCNRWTWGPADYDSVWQLPINKIVISIDILFTGAYFALFIESYLFIYFNFIVFLFLHIFPAYRIRLITANDDIGGGRIEVYHNGQWGTICEKSWSEQAAKVACRELGFKTALYPSKRAFFGEGSGPVMTKHDPAVYK